MAIGPAPRRHLPRERSLGCRPCPPPPHLPGNVRGSRRRTPTAKRTFPWQMWGGGQGLQPRERSLGRCGGRAGPTAKRTFPWQMSGRAGPTAKRTFPWQMSGRAGPTAKRTFTASRAYCQENVALPNCSERGGGRAVQDRRKRVANFHHHLPTIEQISNNCQTIVKQLSKELTNKNLYTNYIFSAQL